MEPVLATTYYLELRNHLCRTFAALDQCGCESAPTEQGNGVSDAGFLPNLMRLSVPHYLRLQVEDAETAVWDSAVTKGTSVSGQHTGRTTTDSPPLRPSTILKTSSV
jgi:hypothetical protein